MNRMILACAWVAGAGIVFAGPALENVTWETLPQFAESNISIVKEPIRGIVVNHVWLGFTQFKANAVAARPDLAERGIVYVSPYAGPWSWMNRQSVALSDAVVDAVKRHYGLSEDVKVVSTGASMGGLAAIMWPLFSHHRVAAVVANCPVTDLEKHYAERPDLPRTLVWAYAGEPDFPAAVRAHSPFHQVARMPKVPYFIAHSTKDAAVAKGLHSDRFVAAMRAAGHRVEYVASEGTPHAKLTPEANAKLAAALLRPFERDGRER